MPAWPCNTNNLEDDGTTATQRSTTDTECPTPDKDPVNARPDTDIEHDDRLHAREGMY